jgi:hypothetical protein
MRASRRGAFLGLMLVLAEGCGGRGSGVPDVPAVTVLEPGVRREVIRLPGVVPPANPETGTVTPNDYNQTQVLRYRQDQETPVPARAIVVAMPGILAGGGSLDPLARALVRRGAAAGEAIEVWAIDRRANLLEDLRGMNAAEATGDPEMAARYYFGGQAFGGVSFPGFVGQDAVAYMSEWGLTTHVEDLHRVIAQVPAAARRGHVFLLGHSLGAAFAEAYAAWRFADGSRGVDELAGLILIDGVLGEAPIDEAAYRSGPAGVFPLPGIDTIRTGTRYIVLPFLGVEVYPRVEIQALRVLVHPTAVTADEGRDNALALLLSLPRDRLPRLSDAAALGLGFDDQSNPLGFTRASLGRATGGPLETYQNPFGGDQIVRPSDPTARYDWVDAREAQPAEWTPLASLAHAIADGRSNFAEWYFPARLALDLQAVAGARIPPGGYQEQYGLRAYDGGLIDAPILAVSAALISASDYDAVRARVAPVIGDGRARAGTPRTDPAAFRVVRAEGMSHLDPVLADDRAENPVPAAVEGFVREGAASGTVRVPRL